jgi:hypothetical protein
VTAPEAAAGEMTQAQVQAIVANAQRLGLIWTLRQATITDVSPVMGAYDGDVDSVSIEMTSMIGSVALEDRVYVLGVPPSGNFITGRVTTPYSSRQVLPAAASSVTFSNIPTNLRSLKLSYSSRGDSAVNVQTISMRINASAAAVYSTENLQANNATATAAPTAGATSATVGLQTGTSAAGGSWGSGTIELNPWDNANGSSLGFTYDTQALGTGVGNFFHWTGGGVYGAGGPYTSITLTPQAGNFQGGSSFLIEGS